MITKLRSIALGAAIASLVGCYAEVIPEPVAYDDEYGDVVVYSQEVPPGVYSYPHVWYEGRWVYLIDDRWYYATSGGWVVYASEPPPLRHHREIIYGHAPPPYHVVQHAPPAHPYHAPPAHPYAPAHPYVAPPAHPQPVHTPPPHTTWPKKP